MASKGPKSTSKPPDIAEGLKESVKIHKDIQSVSKADDLNPTSAIANLLDTTQLVNSLTLAKIAQKQLKEMVSDLDGSSGPTSYKPTETAPPAHPIVSVLEKLPEEERTAWLEANREVIPKLLAGLGTSGESPFLSGLMHESSKPKQVGGLTEFAEVINMMTKTGLLNQSAQSAGMVDTFKMLMLAKEMFTAPKQDDSSLAVVQAIAQMARSIQESNAILLQKMEAMAHNSNNTDAYDKLLEIQQNAFKEQQLLQDRLMEVQRQQSEATTRTLAEQLAALQAEIKTKNLPPPLEPILRELQNLKASAGSTATDKDVTLKQMDLELEKLKLDRDHQLRLAEMQLKADEATRTRQKQEQRDHKVSNIINTLSNYGRAMALMNSVDKTPSPNVAGLMSVKV